MTNIIYSQRLSSVIILLASLASLLVGTSIAAFIYVTRKEKVLRKSHLISVIFIVLIEVAFLIAVVICCNIQSKNTQGQVLAALLIVISFLALMTLIYFLLEDILKERIQPFPTDATVSRTFTVEEIKSQNQQELCKIEPSINFDQTDKSISVIPVEPFIARIPTPPPLLSISPPPEKPSTSIVEDILPSSHEISEIVLFPRKLPGEIPVRVPIPPIEQPQSLADDKPVSVTQERPVTPVKEQGNVVQNCENVSAYMVNYDQIRRDLLAAIEERTIPALEEAIQQVKDHNYIQLLKYECERALELLNRLMKIEHMKFSPVPWERIKVLRLNQSTIAELHSYAKPPDEVSTVMRATFLLLGHSDKEIQDWPQIQSILGKFGRDSVRRRCYELNPLSIPVDKAREAKDILNNYDLIRVSEISVGLSAFFNWAITMIEEREKLLESQRRIVR